MKVKMIEPDIPLKIVILLTATTDRQTGPQILESRLC